MARLFCAASVCLLGIGVPLGLVFSGPNAPEKASSRSLTFTERVAYQRAIEEVRWRHRIWPKENRSPKPALDAVISQAQIEHKVKDYLRKSQLIADQRGRPITASELQAEMERMASHTLHPRVLLELFQALYNDPFVIAECLARPLVAERLGNELSRQGGVEAFVPNAKALTAATALTSQSYKLPQISVPLDCADDTWTATAVVNAPDARDFHTEVWTGSEMIVWGGLGNSGLLNTGGRYDPSTDSWAATSTTNAPAARLYHTAVWTGSEMIIWGGYNYPPGDLDSGGRYNPMIDSWTATGALNAPEGREDHTAVWAGSEMIVWGGAGCTFGNCLLNTGGRYNPTLDSWIATSLSNAPAARFSHRALWTGNEMIVWGGSDRTNYLHTGGRYDPSTDSWTPMGLVNVPLGRIAHTAVWSGGEMIVWGGVDETFNDTNTGGRYDPSTDSWAATSLDNAPSPRDSHAAVWAGSEMIVWGGHGPPGFDWDTGGRYNPAIDAWTPTSTANAPLAREDHTAVWTGIEMIVWGGVSGQLGRLNTGGRYCAQSGATPTPTPTATVTPTATATPAATATPRITPSPRSRPTPQPRP